MAVPHDDRRAPDAAPPHDTASPVNPAEAAPGSTAPGTDRSDDRVLTPGEYEYQPVGSRRPPGEERVYERPTADAGGSEDMSTDASRAEGRELPITDYHTLTIPEIVERLAALSNDELREVQDYERSHRRRKTLLVRMERQLRNGP